MSGFQAAFAFIFSEIVKWPALALLLNPLPFLCHRLLVLLANVSATLPLKVRIWNALVCSISRPATRQTETFRPLPKIANYITCTGSLGPISGCRCRSQVTKQCHLSTLWQDVQKASPCLWFIIGLEGLHFIASDRERWEQTNEHVCNLDCVNIHIKFEL